VEDVAVWGVFPVFPEVIVEGSEDDPGDGFAFGEEGVLKAELPVESGINVGISLEVDFVGELAGRTALGEGFAGLFAALFARDGSVLGKVEIPMEDGFLGNPEDVTLPEGEFCFVSTSAPSDSPFGKDRFLREGSIEVEEPGEVPADGSMGKPVIGSMVTVVPEPAAIGCPDGGVVPGEGLEGKAGKGWDTDAPEVALAVPLFGLVLFPD
jgi:hypothetical protein